MLVAYDDFIYIPLSPERVDSMDSTTVTDFTFILEVINEQYFKKFQTHLDWNDVLSSIAVPSESDKYSIRSL